MIFKFKALKFRLVYFCLIFKDVKFPLMLDIYELCTTELQEKMLPIRSKFKEVEDKKLEKQQQKVMLFLAFMWNLLAENLFQYTVLLATLYNFSMFVCLFSHQRSQMERKKWNMSLSHSLMVCWYMTLFHTKTLYCIFTLSPCCKVTCFFTLLGCR